MEDLKHITGRDLLYLGHNARANMKAYLKAARLKHIDATQLVSAQFLLGDDDGKRKQWLAKRLLEDNDCSAYINMRKNG